jgi:hypothetical protein
MCGNDHLATNIRFNTRFIHDLSVVSNALAHAVLLDFTHVCVHATSSVLRLCWLFRSTLRRASFLKALFTARSSPRT